MSGLPSERAYRQRLPEWAGRVAYGAGELEASFVRLSADERAGLVSWERIHRAFAGGDAADDVAQPGASVLLALTGAGGVGGGAEVILIRRALHLTSNPGEIALPGGRVEAGETAEEAALREAEEEVALDRALVRVVGWLPVTSRASRIERIATLVGLVEGRPALEANRAEVEEVFTVTLESLADPEHYWEESWTRPDGEVRRMPFFALGTDLIWGATARMLAALFERLTAAG